MRSAVWEQVTYYDQLRAGGSISTSVPYAPQRDDRFPQPNKANSALANKISGISALATEKRQLTFISAINYPVVRILLYLKIKKSEYHLHSEFLRVSLIIIRVLFEITKRQRVQLVSDFRLACCRTHIRQNAYVSRLVKIEDEPGHQRYG